MRFAKCATVWFDDDVGEMNLQAGSELKCCETDQVVRLMLLVLLGQLSFFHLKMASRSHYFHTIDKLFTL